jgi:toxin ParE1/3/4
LRRRDVVFAPEAVDDLVRLYEWIANAAGPDTAMAYVERLEAYCLGFDLASERGTLRGDVRPGLRIVGFERRITIAFVVDDQSVTVLRLFYGGRDWEPALT